MKKLVLLSFVFLMCITQAAIAQKAKPYGQTKNSTSDEQSDPQSTAILTKVNQKYSSYKSMQLDLVLTIEDGSYKEVQRGKVSVKGNKFLIESNDQKIVSDGKTNWVYLKKQKELQISNPDPDDIALFSSPDKLLKSYEKDFISALVGEVKEQGKDVYKIEFKPKDRNSEYSKVRVTIDKATSAITNIKVFDKSNIHYTIEVEKFVMNPALNDTLFTFDESVVPKENVIDLRY